MWEPQVESIEPGQTEKYRLLNDGRTVTFGQAIELLCTDSSFRSCLTQVLAEECEFPAYRWETPPVTVSSINRDFEFVLLNSPALERVTDVSAFSEHFNSQLVVTFPNLRGDATMVVPCPIADHTAYCHLASFVRNGPAPQTDALWQAVGTAMENRIGSKPVWLSTAGMGVAWLHVRLDSRPKYYGHLPYRKA